MVNKDLGLFLLHGPKPGPHSPPSRLVTWSQGGDARQGVGKKVGWAALSPSPGGPQLYLYRAEHSNT